ncbi:MAG: oligoendopeptidase F [Ruminococcaceae bacterium]|nr:oligoendopeptidase F [Oscillospiraceae bacterium]
MKTRKEMDPKYMWDFTHMFATKEDWEKAYKECEADIPKIPAYSGRLCESAETLKNALKLISEVSQKAELVYLYAMLHKSGDNGDPEYQAMVGRCVNLHVSLGTSMAFLEPEILACDEETIRKYLEDPELATYKFMAEDILRGRAHMLSKEQEMMLAMLSDVRGNAKDIYGMLESVDMEFPHITDENGNSVQLTHGNFRVFAECSDTAVRRNAFEACFGEFKRYINTFAATYAASVKTDTYFSNVRKFPSACEAALFNSNVPVAVYDSLIEAVHNGLGTMKKYLKIRKEVLGLDDLTTYDLYCPIVSDIDMKVDYEQAKDLVKKACAPLGEDYAKLLDRAYNENWIDVYENKGKTTGAFSCGVFGVHPYVLLNYSGTLDDAFTLAHELGHAMHSFYSDSNQDYINHGYKILVAEVASTVNEVLMTKYLLSVETDKKRRAYIINNFLESFRTTIFRQTLFAEFERIAHEMYASGTPLTAQSLSDAYQKLNEYYYEGATVGELHKYEWARIPHFYNAFYVYQYATGFSSAVAIANHILETGDASAYLEFLKTGGSDYPLNELKIAGVDLTKPETVENAMKVFADCLDEFEQLLKEI